MRVFLNDNIISAREKSRLSDLLFMHCKTEGNYAVAVNETFIPKHSYDRIINNNDRIDIIIPMQGG